MFGPSLIILEPFENTQTGSSICPQFACVAKVLEGSSESLRVALYAEDSSGDIVAAASGR